jgi:predicted nucleotidyltransferase
VSDRDDLVQRLSGVIAGSDARRWVRAAILFGSASRGALRGDSDVDVGVVVGGSSLELREELALQADLSAACGREVDLVRLDTADAMVRWQVASTGIVICSEPGVAARFQAEAALEHADMAPLLEDGAERWRKALLAGRGR